jgi:hypothetical protein
MLTLWLGVDKFGSHTFVSGAAHFVSSGPRRPVVMKSRFVISLLCVGAVAYACGPRALPESGGTVAGTTVASARTVAQQGTPRAASATHARSTPVTAALDVRAEAASIHFALQVVNRGKKTIELTFPSGQTHDFAIVDSLGREVWRWSTGRLFTQALQNRMLSRGDAMSMTESWNAPSLRPGRYTAVATLKSQNYPLSETMEFSVGGAALAVRE